MRMHRVLNTEQEEKFRVGNGETSMYPRTNYEMTEEDLAKLLDASKSIPMIMLHLGIPRSQQDRANDAWAELGERMGFDATTVQPTGKGDRYFTAVPSCGNEEYRNGQNTVRMGVGK